jgi:hypothetical protein
VRRAPALLVIAVLLRAASASAEDANEEAKRLYAEGHAQYVAGHCAEAVRLLEQSAKLVKSPNPGLLIARCLRNDGKRVEAATRYEEVEREALALVHQGEKRYADTAASALKEGAALKAELGTIRANAKHAKIEIEGRQSDTGELTVLHEPGPVKVVFIDTAGRHEQTVDAVVGKETPVAFFGEEPSAAPPATPRMAEPPPPPPPKPESRVPGWLPFVTGGVAIAGFGTFAAFGLASESSYGDLQACSPRCPESERSTADHGRTFQTTANVGLVVGIVLAAATGVIVALR